MSQKFGFACGKLSQFVSLLSERVHVGHVIHGLHHELHSFAASGLLVEVAYWKIALLVVELK